MPVSNELIGSAFLMGLAGSFHCIGMCGPLAFSLPVSHHNKINRISAGFIYNAGRIFSYSLIGLLLGSFGDLVIAIKWQDRLSFILGTIILLYLIIPKRYLHFTSGKLLSSPFTIIQRQLGKLIKVKKLRSLFFVGLLNGFLPCGLVYLALTSAMVSASSVNGAMFMLFFGLGTFPLMFGTVLIGNYLSQSLRARMQHAVPIFLFFMAILLILRGMELGIPFISPGIDDDRSSQVTGCH